MIFFSFDLRIARKTTKKRKAVKRRYSSHGINSLSKTARNDTVRMSGAATYFIISVEYDAIMSCVKSTKVKIDTKKTNLPEITDFHWFVVQSSATMQPQPRYLILKWHLVLLLFPSFLHFHTIQLWRISPLRLLSIPWHHVFGLKIKKMIRFSYHRVLWRFCSVNWIVIRCGHYLINWVGDMHSNNLKTICTHFHYK